jgi:MOSC domain-containing protein YiiM
MACLLSVQIGRSQRVQINGRKVLTGGYKHAVSGQVPVQALGLLGDEQADMSVHGGLDKAVYAYPSEHYPMWQQAREDAGVSGIDLHLPWGSMGENLTLMGVLESDLWVGDVLRFPNCALRVTQPREPCYKFNATMGFWGAARLMASSGHCGIYLAVEEPGHLRAGVAFELVAGPRCMRIDTRFKARSPQLLK